MKAVGIIAEYNPFSNGHLYHLKKVKEMYKDYCIVLVLSGNFTERGDVSIINKFKKAEIALIAGIDLVIELPFPFATQSADFFAYGAITILEKLNVEKVIFGSESNNIEDLELIVDTQINNPDFEKLVHIYSKFGNNYPTSLSLAIKDLTGKVIDTPNDLLGISYLKVIKENNYKIKAETILRTNNYHDTNLKGKISSATAIRLALKNKEDVSLYVPDFVKPYLNNLHFIDDYFKLLRYKIISEDDLTIYQTVTEGIDNLIKKEIVNVKNTEELIDKLKSKRYTHNKIQRMLLHILVGFTKQEANEFRKVTYIRLLGFSKNGRKYLNEIKKIVDVPIISKISKNKDKMLEFEIKTTKIYEINSSNYTDAYHEEYENHCKGE